MPSSSCEVETAQQSKHHVLTLAQEALAESPAYIDHIQTLLSRSADCFRSGDDTAGMRAFARAASDLDQFVKLTEQLRTAAEMPCSGELDAFQRSVESAVLRLNQALCSQELVALSDEIEGGVVPLLQRWPQVAEELRHGIKEQRS